MKWQICKGYYGCNYYFDKCKIVEVWPSCFSASYNVLLFIREKETGLLECFVCIESSLPTVEAAKQLVELLIENNPRKDEEGQ